jgi:carboxylate-amine ligase
VRSTSRTGEGPTLGVEEELFLVDAETGALANAASTLLAGRDTPYLKRELFDCIVESATPAVTRVSDLRSSLEEARAGLVARCERHGLRLSACGSHPFRRDSLPAVTTTPHYQGVARILGASLPQHVICGLHVHVGLPTRERAENALEGVIPWLPAMLALSVNSPYADGSEAGVLSVRADRLGRLGASPLPPVTAGVRTAQQDQATDWWDVRVNRRYGTLEIRVADQPTAVERSVSLAALAQALVILADGQRNPNADRAVYLRARTSALTGTYPIARLVAHVEPVAADLRTWNLIVNLLDSELEAERQLRIGRRDGLEALVHELVSNSTP